jgi:hypothetical protein
MKKINWINYLIAYFMWAVTTLMGLWSFLQFREALLTWLGLYYLNGNLQHKYSAPFITQFSSLIAGLILFILIIVIEEYFRDGAGKGDLIRRIVRVMGLLLLLIAAIDLITIVMLGVAIVGWIRLAIGIVELLVGGVLAYIGLRRKPAVPLPPLPPLTPFTGEK